MTAAGEGLLAGVFVLYGFSAAFGLVASILPAQKAVKVLRLMRRVALAAAGLTVLAFAWLVVAFLSDDFTVAAVAQYSSSDLPFFYKVSAVWAGSAGSLFFWFACLTILYSFRLIRSGIGNKVFDSVSLSAGSCICLAFAALLLFFARPFASAGVTIDEGLGLNPQLLNFWMVIHPPLLFIGYAALAMPFVIVTATAAARIADDPAVFASCRRWLLLGLVFLTAGIVTGAKWSYVELGWGGYWAWDPVENASLLPWLVSLAAIHSIVGRRYSQKFRSWSLVLPCVPWILCLMATFITRSGVIQSVHAFGREAMTSALLALIILSLVLWLYCIVRTAQTVGFSLPQLGTPIMNVAGLLFWAVLIFLALTLVVGISTFFPVIARPFTGSESAPVVTRKFYDTVTAGAAAVSAFLVGLSILASMQHRRAFILYALLCSAVGLCGYGFVLRRPETVFHTAILMALVCGVCAFGLIAILTKLVLYLRTGGRAGGTISHLGFVVLVVAAGFAAAETTAQSTLDKGDKLHIGGYELTYESVEHKITDGAARVGPMIHVKKGRLEKTLWPHRVLYANEKTASEVAVHTGVLEDLYLSFDEQRADGKAVISAKVIPFVFWIWVAFILLVGGPLWALFEGPRRGQTETVRCEDKG